MPITPSNVVQVNELFKWIIEGDYQLDPAIVFNIQKLWKGAAKAIANASIQRTTNVDLIEAELTKKKQSDRGKGKSYAFGHMLNKETIKEREAFKMLKEKYT